jgi:hypothetical protein
MMQKREEDTRAAVARSILCRNPVPEWFDLISLSIALMVKADLGLSVGSSVP